MSDTPNSSTHSRKKLNRLLIGWCVVAVLNATTLIYTYWELPARFAKKTIGQSGYYCTTVPFQEIFSRLLQPRFWFLLVSLAFLSIYAYKILGLLEPRLKINRLKQFWLLPLITMTIILFCYFIITKAVCWS